MTQVLQTPLFKRQKKKLHKWQISKLDEEVRRIIANPKIGQLKKGELAGIYMHKFKFFRT